MTTPRIEEIAGEVWRLIKDEWEEKDGKLPSGWTGIGSAYGSYSRLIEALTEAHQAGIDDAVEKMQGMKKEINELNLEVGNMDELIKESYNQALDDTIEALQDKK